LDIFADIKSLRSRRTLIFIDNHFSIESSYSMNLKKSWIWIIFILFSIAEIYYTWIYQDRIPASIETITIVLGCAFFLFLGYTLYCSEKENLFKSIGKIAKLHWGRQIGVDLYIGLFFQSYLIYLNEESVLETIIWVIPLLVYGNIATLLYWLLNAGSILTKF